MWKSIKDYNMNSTFIKPNAKSLLALNGKVFMRTNQRANETTDFLQFHLYKELNLMYGKSIDPTFDKPKEIDWEICEIITEFALLNFMKEMEKRQSRNQSSFRGMAYH